MERWVEKGMVDLRWDWWMDGVRASRPGLYPMRLLVEILV